MDKKNRWHEPEIQCGEEISISISEEVMFSGHGVDAVAGPFRLMQIASQ